MGALQPSGRGYWGVLLGLMLLWLPASRAWGGGTTNAVFTYVRPPNCSDEMLSSNWWDEVRCALPTNRWGGKKLDWRLATNELARESRRGNLAAQGLWGFTMVNCTPLTAPHPDREINAGLQLMENSASNGYVPSMSRLAKLCTASPVVQQDFNEAFHWYQTAAAKGDAESRLHLGGCYYQSRGTAPDPIQAAENYRLAAEATNYTAMKDYGCMLMDGIGVTQDLEAAKQWFLRAAKEGGNRRAMNNLGAIYSRNFSDSNSLAQAFDWFKQSAALGDPLACLQLSLFYYHGWGVVQTNLESYREWRLKAANLGATESQYEMAVAYRIGDGVPIDPREAIRWYTRAAAKNHPLALYDLSLIYASAPNPTPMDIKISSDMMRRAAEGGHREAQFLYAQACFRGRGMALDCEAGRRWLARSATLGWGSAEYYLFDLYFHGTAAGPNCPGYPKDEAEGLKWLRRSAEHGDFQAESVLGVILLQSTNQPPDRAEVERLFRDAAMHGYAPAMNDLGFAILRGDLNDRDLVDSAMWCKLAGEHAVDTNTLRLAEANLAQVTPRLTMAQMLDLNERLGSIRLLPPEAKDPLLPGWENNPAYRQEDGDGDH